MKQTRSPNYKLLLLGAMCLVLGLTACSGKSESGTSADLSARSAGAETSSSAGTGRPDASKDDSLPAMAALPSQPAGTETPPSAGTGKPNTAEDDGLPYGNPTGFDRDGLPAAFADAIEAYCRSGTFPDGQDGGEIPSAISYAVLDIDGDGQDELILQNSNTMTAAMTERIYAYENGVFREKLSEFPALTYYNNGIIQAMWSHNQGLAGERLWPYTLYQPNAGGYEVLGSVDAWAQERSGAAGDLGAFPDELDTDGDGCVYFLLPPDWAGQYSRASIVDGPAYEAWRDQYLSGAEALVIPYQDVEVETVFPRAAG